MSRGSQPRVTEAATWLQGVTPTGQRWNEGPTSPSLAAGGGWVFKPLERWSSNPSAKCSYERPTQVLVCDTMRIMGGAEAGCLAINYQSLFSNHAVSAKGQRPAIPRPQGKPGFQTMPFPQKWGCKTGLDPNGLEE